MASGDVDFGA